MYADDTTVYFNTEDFPKDNLGKHITTVDIWLKHNKLSLSVEKLNAWLLTPVRNKLNFYNYQ